MQNSTKLLLVSWALWATSLPLPALGSNSYSGQPALGISTAIMSLAVWADIFSAPSLLYVGSLGLCNLLMLLSPIAFRFFKIHRWQIVRWLMIATFPLSLSWWFYGAAQGWRNELLLGYYFWTAAFGLLAWACIRVTIEQSEITSKTN